MPDLESLRNSKDFRRVLREGNRRRKGGIVVVRSPGRPGTPRLGLIVSRGSGNAVTRNRTKRRLRHAVGQLQLQPGMDYVIIASGQVAEAEFAQIKGWLARAIEELSNE
ncbi:MAG: ribonuclease P protein component [Actinomycetota bacterium]|nr:ribonuclease P protein component [Actinomycetota bacterium]